MSVDLATWLSGTDDPAEDALAGLAARSEVARAAAAWRRIVDKPSSVRFRTPAGTTLAAQTVRLEYDNAVGQSEAASGLAAVRKVTVFGVRNHPTLGDTNVGEGYRFVLDGDQYTVVEVIKTLGEVQAIAEIAG
jgi:hypothetical protein